MGRHAVARRQHAKASRNRDTAEQADPAELVSERQVGKEDCRSVSVRSLEALATLRSPSTVVSKHETLASTGPHSARRITAERVREARHGLHSERAH